MIEVVTNNPEKCNKALVALYQVIDPEIGLNVVDLGLLYEIDFDEPNKRICLTMTLTTQFCPMGESIRNNADKALQRLFPEYTTDIELVFDPPWNLERISEGGREFLNR